MASPLAHGLLQRALEERSSVGTDAHRQSATVRGYVGDRDEGARLRDKGDARGIDCGCTRRRTRRAEAAVRELLGYRGASVDGYVLPTLPARIFAEGHEAPVPLVIGSNVQGIVPRSQTAAETNHLIAYAVGPQYAPALEEVYAQQATNPLEGDAVARFRTDRDFRCAVRQVAAWHASHGFATFVYQFDRSAGPAKAVQHSAELVFGFPIPAANDSQVPSADDGTSALRFGRSGRPSRAPAPLHRRQSCRTGGASTQPRATTSTLPRLHAAGCRSGAGRCIMFVVERRSSPGSH